MVDELASSQQKPPTHGSVTAPEEIRKVQSSDLRCADGLVRDASVASGTAPPEDGAVVPPGEQLVTANDNGYTSDTAAPTSSARQRNAPRRGASSTRSLENV
jgi:hypothetical protein